MQSLKDIQEWKDQNSFPLQQAGHVQEKSEPVINFLFDCFILLIWNIELSICIEDCYFGLVF